MIQEKDINLPDEWLNIGHRYMEHARSLSDWESFINGFVHTNSYKTVADNKDSASAVIIDSIKQLFPTPEKAKEECSKYKSGKDTEKVLSSMVDMRSKKRALDYICTVAENWDDVKDSIHTCKINPNSTEDVVNEMLKLRKDGKLKGFFYKGIDMLALDSGCEDVVLDIWMFEAMDMLGHRRDVDRIREIQTRKEEYYKYKKDVEKAVKEKGYPLGDWHVGKWLETTTGGDLDSAKRFVEQLFSSVE